MGVEHNKHKPHKKACLKNRTSQISQVRKTYVFSTHHLIKDLILSTGDQVFLGFIKATSGQVPEYKILLRSATEQSEL